MKKHIENILAMTGSKVLNYGIAGVDSSLVNKGLVRVFECSREHQEAVTPHSHKFDFSCLVLEGKVRNRIWTELPTTSAFDDEGDLFMVSDLKYLGDMGKYEKTPNSVSKFTYDDDIYTAGDWYSMTYDQIHSIYFGRNTKVLFFEGETITNDTIILDPYVNGKHVPTFDIKPWMFEKV